MSMLRMARVAAVHPEDHSVDIVMVDDGSRYPGAQVLTPHATTNSGTLDLPEVEATSNKWDLTQNTSRDMIAIVAFISPTVPIVLGFMFPQVNQVLFADKDRRIVRHASDVYSTIDGAGNTELSHPSGTYLRIGTSPDHEDLTGKDFDKQWAISKNTGAAVYVKLRVANAGVDKASLTIDPSGNVTLQCDGNLSATIGGTTLVDSAGDATLKAPNVTIDSPQTTCTGKLTVQGLLTYEAGMAGSGGTGSTASITGPVNITGDVSTTGALNNNGKDVGGGHRHANSGGSGTGGAPI